MTKMNTAILITAMISVDKNVYSRAQASATTMSKEEQEE